MIENVYAPFSLPLHLTFCIIASLFYLYMLKRKGFRHYLYLIIAIDLTLIPQFYPDKVLVFRLGIAEAVLLFLIFASMIRISIRGKKEKKARLKKVQGKADVVADAFSDEN